jgi:hypothetical protein
MECYRDSLYGLYFLLLTSNPGQRENVMMCIYYLDLLDTEFLITIRHDR